jgi:hypothetical protein
MADDVTATSWAPTAKVSVGALAGAGTTLIMGILKVGHPGFSLDASSVAAITCILTFAIQYMVPERK